MKLTGEMKKEHEARVEKQTAERYTRLNEVLVGFSKEEFRTVKKIVAAAMEKVGK